MIAVSKILVLIAALAVVGIAGETVVADSVDIAPEPEIRILPLWTVAAVVGSGDDDAVWSSFGRIFSWLSSAQVPMVGKPFAVRYENSSTSPESLRFLAAIPVPDHVVIDDTFGIAVREWGGFRVAVVARFGLDKSREPALAELRDWIAEQEWEVAGSPVEFHLELPGNVPDDSVRTEFAYPVRRPESR